MESPLGIQIKLNDHLVTMWWPNLCLLPLINPHGANPEVYIQQPHRHAIGMLPKIIHTWRIMAQSYLRI